MVNEFDRINHHANGHFLDSLELGNFIQNQDLDNDDQDHPKECNFNRINAMKRTNQPSRNSNLEIDDSSFEDQILQN